MGPKLSLALTRLALAPPLLSDAADWAGIPDGTAVPRTGEGMTLKINTVVSSVKTPLAVGPTTPVIVRVFKANGKFGNADGFDASRVIVTEGY